MSSEQIQDTARALEALLFVSGDPMTVQEITRLLQISKQAFTEAKDELIKSLEHRGICLVEHNETFSLSTKSTYADIITRFAQEEYEGPLTRATLETLAIILWKGQTSRAEIDYIRGVNSTSALRTLLMRGLIERKVHSEDARIFQYTATIDLYRFLGISKREELPEFDDIIRSLESAQSNDTHD